MTASGSKHSRLAVILIGLGGFLSVARVAPASSWERRYANLTDSLMTFVREAPDGGLFVVQATYDPDAPQVGNVRMIDPSRTTRLAAQAESASCFTVMKTDEAGAVKWRFKYDLGDLQCKSARGVAATDDGGLVVLVAHTIQDPSNLFAYVDIPVLVRIDQLGGVRWSYMLQPLGQIAAQAKDIAVSRADGSIVIAGGPWVATFDRDGNLLATYVVQKDSLVNFAAAASTNKGVVIGGEAGDCHCAFAAGFDTGNTWVRGYSPSQSFTWMRTTPDGSSLFAGGFSSDIVKLTPQGDVVWSGFMLGNGIIPPIVDSAGRLWWIGTSVVERLLPDHTSDALKLYDKAGVRAVIPIRATANGGMIFAGFVYQGPVTLLRHDADASCLVTAVADSPRVSSWQTTPVATTAGAAAAGGLAAVPVTVGSTCIPGTVELLCGTPPTGAGALRATTTQNNSCDVVQLDFEFVQPQKVLMHKYRQDDGKYPSDYQERLRNDPLVPTPDGKIDVRVRATSNGVPVPDRAIYFRVTDPADTAAYVVAYKDAKPNDNRDTAQPLGSLTSAAPCDAPPPEGISCARSDGNGWARVILTGTDHASGDNYRVQASLDSGFTCADTCPQSGLITAWKRVYLETARMFRRGSYLIEASAGNTVRVEDATAFREAQTIRIIHGPAYSTGQASPRIFAEEGAIIAKNGVVRDPRSKRGSLVLDRTLLSTFDSVPDTSLVGSAPASGDFVGVVTGNDVRDFWSPVTRYVQTLFADAYVEYLFLPSPLTALPFAPEFIHDKSDVVKNDGYIFGERWFENLGAPNHQMLYAANDISTSRSDGTRGQTIAAEGLSASFILPRLIRVPLSSGQTARLQGEAIAHEIAHQWHVDRWSSHSTNGEHDNFNYYDDSGKKCLMHPTYGEGQVDPLPEFVDDRVIFHYVTSAQGADSEYLWIRNRCEPIPVVNPVAQPVDWWIPSPPTSCY